MKKITKFLLTMLGCSALFFGCVEPEEDSHSMDVKPGTIGDVPENIKAASLLMKSVDPNNEKVILIYSRPDSSYSDWGLWLWETGGECKDAFFNATKGKFLKDSATGYGYMSISDLGDNLTSGVKSAIENKTELNVIIRNAGWVKDPGTDQVLDLSSGSKHFMVISGDTTVYTIKDIAQPTITSAQAIDSKSIKVVLNVKYGLGNHSSDSGFKLKDSDGVEYRISSSKNADEMKKEYKNNADKVILTCAGELPLNKVLYVSHDGFGPESGAKVGMTAAIKEGLLKSVVPVNELGVKVNGNKASFATWAPTATSVSLLLYPEWADVVAETQNPTVKNMTFDASTGKWTVSDVDVSNSKYYKYRISTGSESNDIADIYSYVAGPDAIASQICSIDDASTKPAGWETSYTNPFTGKYENAVIYEMHIRDWSRAAVTDSTGTYLDFADDKIINHLKDIGVTHVQILPMFEHAENIGAGYNWGYNPYHYNVPETRYVSSAKNYSHANAASHFDGSQAVLEMRTMIKKLHDAGIAVIMDVVYNHTSGTGKGSLYDMTVPYYFYRLNADGSYSNGSGCGNETDSEAPMFRAYMIDSLKHWMKDYHINGFRFDLMGVHSKEAMKEIYDALYAIDSNVMVYGEPWTGGTALVKNGATQAVKGSAGYGAGAFDDDFRDAIKGAEFGGFKAGQVQGTFNDSDIVKGLEGKTGKNKRNETGLPGMALHYVECHDNYTLFDKLAICMWQKEKNSTNTTSGDLISKISEEGLATVKKEDSLAGAFVLLSQGTAFLNGGQDFCRTKRGNENSYNKTDLFNQIDLRMKETNADVYNTYKGLIALRKANPSAFGGNKSASASTVKTGVTKYTTGDYLVYFNATDSDESVSCTGYTKAVDVTSGTPVESSTLPSKVAAKSFVILKK